MTTVVTQDPAVKMFAALLDDNLRQFIGAVSTVRQVRPAEGLSKATLDRVDKYNAALEKTKAEAKEAGKPFVEAIEKLTTNEATVFDLSAKVDKHRTSTLTILDRACALVRECESLAGAISEELEPLAQSKQAAADKALQDAKAYLAKGGWSADVMPAGPFNGFAANIQLEKFCKLQPQYRDAQAAADDSANVVSSYRELRSGCPLRNQELQALASAIVLRAVAI